MQLYKIVTRFYPWDHSSSVELQTKAAYDIATATRKISEIRAEFATRPTTFDIWMMPL